MTQGFSRRGFLTSVCAAGLFAAAPARANAPLRSLRPAARGEDLRLRSLRTPEDLIAAARLDGEVGFAVVTLSSGRVLEQHGAAIGLPPASVAKALTASYALDTLGPGYHFATEILITGAIAEGVVEGDLVLLGGGDPTLDTDGLAELAGMLREKGVTGVKGRFLVCGSALPYTRSIDPDQPEHVGYSPAVSGLNLNYNRVHFEWRQGGNGYQVSMDARSETLRPAVHMARMGVVARDVPVYTYRDGGARDEWTVARGALGKGGARWLPVRKPELYAGEVFQALAGGQGIALPAPGVVETCPEGEVVVRRESAPLRVVLRDMLKWSTNLTAEIVGQTATRARHGAVGSLRESAEAMNLWAREALGLSHVHLVDHSGLGDQSRISAADMAQALVQIRTRLGLKPLLKSFPMRDAQRRIIKDHPIQVHAKTGTLNFVSGLAGFADLPDGTELVFAIFCGDLDRRAGLSRAERERPEGAVAWNRRAKALQQGLIERWAVLSGS
ncbi:D-alanyl-D-alanine carboxypeptidase/D-alanyl-D-alanine-endopeptidase [Salipiger sp. P9]|uniref:D-alanyl-D-alanine carboxypeptidase/D-alanyl-D-alanine endopeptidase n=1 Tax=Salipiger pentaromativorans TaxID=2943193 RepID=UPI00215789EE|nr:D-alanyl-D-alanine carboxypeptidase/D-alanyl-D-alanine-endopeptidase [Salipiger pentaromativorans]MCR8547846.1 D-alanyl-D-alanine carboxypeptidase/D-alanyl-D-alanine-endopeptidase [Salipiger pentaromativorans]